MKKLSTGKYLTWLMMICIIACVISGCRVKEESPIKDSGAWTEKLTGNENAFGQLDEKCIIPKVEFNGVSYLVNSTEIALSGFGVSDLAFLENFSNLETVDLRGKGRSTQEMLEIQEAYPDIRFLFTFTLYELGIPEMLLDSTITNLDLTGHEITDLDALRRYLKVMPDLEELVMLDCGPTNEEMAEIREEFRNVKVVWMLHLGYHELRTDVIAFSTMSWEHEWRRVDSEDCEIFKYCEDILALDLGHQSIDDLTFLYYMPNLHVLILADNLLRDITPIGSLTELRYLEIFNNDNVESFEPIANLKKLTDLNVSYDYCYDYEYFFELPNLERLWYIGTFISYWDMNRIYEGVPEGCKVIFGNRYMGSTANGWRNSPKQEAQYQGFLGNYLDPMFAD